MSRGLLLPLLLACLFLSPTAALGYGKHYHGQVAAGAAFVPGPAYLSFAGSSFVPSAGLSYMPLAGPAYVPSVGMSFAPLYYTNAAPGYMGLSFAPSGGCMGGGMGLSSTSATTQSITDIINIVDRVSDLLRRLQPANPPAGGDNNQLLETLRSIDRRLQSIDGKLGRPTGTTPADGKGKTGVPKDPTGAGTFGGGAPTGGETLPSPDVTTGAVANLELQQREFERRLLEQGVKIDQILQAIRELKKENLPAPAPIKK